jgi:acyl carrier protein
MVLDDALYGEVDAHRLASAARPKLGGAVLLDRLTRDAPVDHFVLFSSVAALIGNPGQAAYAAANAGLEAVARARLAAGLPALAVQWGPIADAGVLAADAAARQRLEDGGAPPMAAARALDALETALAGRRAGDAVLAVAPLRWSRLAAEMPLLRGPLLERLETGGDGAARPEAQADLRASLAGLDDTAAQRRLVELFRAEAAAILRLDPAEIDPGRPMADLGFDSLMAVELKLSAEQRHGIVLPVFALAEGATLSTLAARVLADLRRGEAPAREDDLAATLVARHAGAGQAAIVARLRGADGEAP